jgi:hypothetical protein
MYTVVKRLPFMAAFLLVWAVIFRLPARPGEVPSPPPHGLQEDSGLVYLPVLLNGDETPALLYGLDFSPHLDGQSPDAGNQISEDQLRSRMQVIAPFAQWIRIYGMESGLELSGQVAHQMGLKAALGAWLNRDPTANQAQITRLIQVAQAGLLIVGSEILYRGDLSPAQLIAAIQQVKAAVPASIQVTTTDTLTAWLQNPQLVAGGRRGADERLSLLGRRRHRSCRFRPGKWLPPDAGQLGRQTRHHLRNRLAELWRLHWAGCAIYPKCGRFLPGVHRLGAPQQRRPKPVHRLYQRSLPPQSQPVPRHPRNPRARRLLRLWQKPPTHRRLKTPRDPRQCLAHHLTAR